VEPQTALPAPEEPSEAEQIRAYLDQGLTMDQLVKELHFKESTVRQEIAKWLIAQNKQKESQDSGTSLPLVIRDGKGEMVSPEAVYWRLVSEDVNGEQDFKALMKWAVAADNEI